MLTAKTIEFLKELRYIDNLQKTLKVENVDFDLKYLDLQAYVIENLFENNHEDFIKAMKSYSGNLSMRLIRIIMQKHYSLDAEMKEAMEEDMRHILED